MPHTVARETFSPNAIGVGANGEFPTFAPTPMALELNVKCLIHGRVKSTLAASIQGRGGD